MTRLTWEHFIPRFNQTLSYVRISIITIFRFSKLTVKENRQLCTKKATQSNDIPVKISKEKADIFANYMSNFFNECNDQGEFPFNLKNTNITPVFKKSFRGSVENYRLVSILPVISKAFEKQLVNKITSYTDKFLSKYQCGFRKGCSAQYCLLAMLEKWERHVDQGKVFGALLTDLYRAFDCLPHELIIAKLSAYRFNLAPLKLIDEYLPERGQRTKINNSYST